MKKYKQIVIVFKKKPFQYKFVFQFLGILKSESLNVS